MTIDKKLENIEKDYITYKRKDIPKIIKEFERFEERAKLGLKIKSRLLVKDSLNLLEQYIQDLPEKYQNKYNQLKKIYERQPEDYWNL